jgi:hypothetical protein
MQASDWSGWMAGCDRLAYIVHQLSSYPHPHTLPQVSADPVFAELIVNC